MKEYFLLEYKNMEDTYPYALSREDLVVLISKYDLCLIK